MTDLERRALLGDREAQEDCTPPAPDEEWIGEDTPERDSIPEPDSPLICNGDKIDCPYLRRVDGKLGYCPLPRCVMEWGE